MKRISLLIFIVALLTSCGNRRRSIQNIDGKSVHVENIGESNMAQDVVYSVDELLENAADLLDTEVTVKGTVVHVCQQHAGKRCQLMGSSENLIIRVEAGERIGTFMQEQMGSDLTITGVLKEVMGEHDSDNPNRGQGEGRGMGKHGKEGKGLHRKNLSDNGSGEKTFVLRGLIILKEES